MYGDINLPLNIDEKKPISINDFFCISNQSTQRRHRINIKNKKL